MKTSLEIGALIVALLAVFLFNRRLIARCIKSFFHDIWDSQSLPDGLQRLWDTRLKIIAALGVILAAGWAVYSYNITAERELRKGFWDKQVSLYFEVSDAAATIATLPADDGDRKKAEVRFWQLYFGPLRVVEDDKHVGTAMLGFGLCLTHPGDSKPRNDCDTSELLIRSLKLAEQCRFSIANDWDRKLVGLKTFN